MPVLTCGQLAGPARWLSLALAALVVSGPAWSLDAFPGASGYGRATQGGRGGKIIYVSNLNDAGRGSFRACAEATGRRNCIFRVAGVITLETPIAISGERGNLSVLGQTAPGGGILVTMNPMTKSPIKTPVYLKGASNVLIRHLRVRLQFKGPHSQTGNGFTVENSQHVYVDHLSTSWALDESFATHRSTTELTVAYSIFGEGLENHSKCALLGSDPKAPQNISFWRNICVSNNDRNPDNNHHGGSCIEIVNNILYNARSEWGEVFSHYPGGTPISFVSNYFKAGPNTNKKTYAVDWQTVGGVADPQIFLRRNATWAPPGSVIALVAPDTKPHVVSAPPCSLSAAVIDDPNLSYDEVRRRAGAFPRDHVDRRLIAEIADRGVAGAGAIRSLPGHLPAIPPGDPYVDVDLDGMADSQEDSVGGVVGARDPWADGDGNGWSNFDEFMEMLSRNRVAGKYPN